MKKDGIIIVGWIGFFIASYGIISAIFYSNLLWYIYLVTGGTLFLSYINYFLKNKSIFKKNKLNFFRIYLLYFLVGIIIEIIGNYWFNLWIYPSFNFLETIIPVFFINYPFALFFAYESFILIKKIIKSFWLTITLTTLVNAFVHEWPNTFVWMWKYTIPYIKFEILKINIVVIIGWVILVIIPLIVENTKKINLTNSFSGLRKLSR